MSRIDQETVQRILDTADIVEVVSDFVRLKKRGSNYIGLCPFHNERTPSFSVSKAKGLCKCFSCGKGGSAVGFLMELEQLSYVEALKYLARKYNIEIKEKELTDEERDAINARESLFAVNQFALDFFEKTLETTDEGRDIGKAYFLERGINENAIKRFHLGFSPEARDALYREARSKGFETENLVTTGVCTRNEQGVVRDRFRGRVIYPVFNIAGKVVAFGGRTLRNDKTVAKYVNSPESIIYSKSKELYGLYQAKQSIVKKDKCLLVEGYMDVISMAQLGIENVVASSGTSLTEGQIRLIHRFTENVTVIYDSDPAGIKASLRGIDMLLTEGMKIKVLLLPEGDDPDSFAQSHTLEEVEEYMKLNEQDFIRFKTDILLKDASDDPIKRASVITDIVKSIACIPDMIARTVYTGECARLLNVDETVLKLEIEKITAKRLEDKYNQNRKIEAPAEEVSPVTLVLPKRPVADSTPAVEKALRHVAQCEAELLRYVVKYGVTSLATEIEEGGELSDTTVLQYIEDELTLDQMTFSVPSYAKLFEHACHVLHNEWEYDLSRYYTKLLEEISQEKEAAISEINKTAHDLGDIKRREAELDNHLKECENSRLQEYAANYLVTKFVSSPDEDIRNVSVEMGDEKHQLSKVHTKYTHVETEYERLCELVPRSIINLKDAQLGLKEAMLRDDLRKLNPEESDYAERATSLMGEILALSHLRSRTSNLLDRVIRPR